MIQSLQLAGMELLGNLTRSIEMESVESNTEHKIMGGGGKVSDEAGLYSMEYGIN